VIAKRAASSNSLERALELLEILERTPGGLRNADLSRALTIPKSTCSYILTRLERKGYVLRDPTSQSYKIGLTTVALAHGALREIGLRSMAEPALYRLTTETGLSAGIGVLERGHVLLIDRVEGSRFVDRAAQDAAFASSHARPRRMLPDYRAREQRDIGRELPAHSTALGKVLLAFLPRPERLEWLAQAGLARRTPRTIVSKSKLLSELEAVRTQGFAMADQEAYLGVRALSAPILDSSGTVRAAVSVNGHPAESAWEDIPALIRLVKAAAQNISDRTNL